MTISSEINKSGPYDGNGSATEFDWSFNVSDASEVQVILTDTDDVETIVDPADYTAVRVDAGDDLGKGTVTMTVAPATGEKITLLINIPFTQETDLQNQGAFDAEVVETALDKAAQRDLMLKEMIDRAVLLPASDDLTSPEELRADIVSLAAIATEISTVSSVSEDISSVAGNLPAILAVEDQAQSVADGAIQTGQDVEQTALDREQTGLDAGAASGYAAAAEKWAEEDEDVEVEGGKFSALHWAKKAEGFGDITGYLTQTAGDARYLGITATAANSSKLANLSAASVDTGNTIAARTASGDIEARLTKTSYANHETMDPTAGVNFRINDAADNFHRTASPAAFKAYCVANGINDGGDAATLDGSPASDFSKRKWSGLISVATLTDGASWAHGLGYVPKNCGMVLVCKTANNGWAVGDIYPDSGGDPWYGKQTIAANDTQVKWVASAVDFVISNVFGTGTTNLNVSFANWEVKFWVEE